MIEPGHSAVASHVAIWPGISWSVVLPMVDPENGYGINKLTGKHIDDDIILRRPSRHGFTAEQPHNTSMFYLMWVFGLVSRSTLTVMIHGVKARPGISPTRCTPPSSHTQMVAVCNGSDRSQARPSPWCNGLIICQPWWFACGPAVHVDLFTKPNSHIK